MPQVVQLRGLLQAAMDNRCRSGGRHPCCRVAGRMLRICLPNGWGRLGTGTSSANIPRAVESMLRSRPRNGNTVRQLTEVDTTCRGVWLMRLLSAGLRGSDTRSGCTGEVPAWWGLLWCGVHWSWLLWWLMRRGRSAGEVRAQGKASALGDADLGRERERSAPLPYKDREYLSVNQREEAELVL